MEHVSAMTPETSNVVSVLVTGALTGIAGFVASRKGGKEGSAGALNGTAEAVRRIETAVLDVGKKLDGHIQQTAENFRELSDRTSTIEGQIQRVPKRAPRRKAA
jgi:hypothetical protein